MPRLVTTFERTVAKRPLIDSPTNVIFSPAAASICATQERSSRSVKSVTNSACSSGVRACQCRPSAWRAISLKSNVSRAIFRISAQRSGTGVPSTSPARMRVRILTIADSTASRGPTGGDAIAASGAVSHAAAMATPIHRLIVVSRAPSPP